MANYKRLTRDVEYFIRKEYLERLKKIGGDFSLPTRSLNNSNNSFMLIVNPMIISQHVFSYFEAYSSDWTRFLLVCKEWFECIVMQDDGLLWRELYRSMLNGMTKYYKVLSPFNSLNYQLESFDSIRQQDVNSYRVNEENCNDEKFKEIPDKTWKENYDDILIHSLGLKKLETEFDSKTTRYIARCFLDAEVKFRNRGELASVRELFLHKFLFDAIFPMILKNRVESQKYENPLLRSDLKILEKKLYFVETSWCIDTLLNIMEVKKGLMLRISYLSSEDGLVHHQFYGTTENDRNLKFLIDVEESSIILDAIPVDIHQNLRHSTEFETIQLATGMDSIIHEEFTHYLTTLQELLEKKFGNIHLAELFCKYWYCINRIEDPVSVSFSDENPFWFLDILSKKAKTSIEKKFLDSLSVSCVSILTMCRQTQKDWISLSSFHLGIEDKKKKKKKQETQPESKDLTQVNSKLETFNLSVDDCWNWRGILIRQKDSRVVLEGLITSREGILLFGLDVYNAEQGCFFTFKKLN